MTKTGRGLLPESMIGFPLRRIDMNQILPKTTFRSLSARDKAANSRVQPRDSLLRQARWAEESGFESSVLYTRDGALRDCPIDFQTLVLRERAAPLREGPTVESPFLCQTAVLQSRQSICSGSNGKPASSLRAKFWPASTPRNKDQKVGIEIVRTSAIDEDGDLRVSEHFNRLAAEHNR